MTDSHRHDPAGPWTIVYRRGGSEQRLDLSTLTEAISTLYNGEEYMELSAVAIRDAAGEDVLAGETLRAALAGFEFGRWPQWVTQNRPDLDEAAAARPATAATPASSTSPGPPTTVSAAALVSSVIRVASSITVELGPLREGDAVATWIGGRETRYTIEALPNGQLTYRQQPPAETGAALTRPPG